ncbi:hypothetical protein PIB30_019167 [Stylosanthes scabra]|uniref:Uncharacterized protein n=1 Tax=Stylosanthes scabra TaxID=79078 RepID=A0ABU6Y6G9_9FABA|nr:hypothetical protein [Stylosanthes scabra]
MMVETKTTARDWQWLDDVMAEDALAAPPAQKNRRMPVSYGCRRGAGRPHRDGRAGGGRGEGGDALMSDMMRKSGSAYRPDMQFDGSPVHLELNEPMSGLLHLFMALGGTPPSASHVPGASWDVRFMEPAHLPTPPVSPAPAEQPDEVATPGRARRAPRHRGCGTGGYM